MPIKSFMHRELLRRETIGYIINFCGVARVVYFSVGKVGCGLGDGVSVQKTVNLRECAGSGFRVQPRPHTWEIYEVTLAQSGKVLSSCIAGRTQHVSGEK